MTAAGSEPATSFTTKFSDLVGYLQLLQTRIAITLAAIALTGTAAGTVAPLLPHPPDGAMPVLVYLAAIALTFSALRLTQVIEMPVKLRQLIFERLKTRALTYADFVETELQREFVAELERKQKGLDTATKSLIFGLVSLGAHAYSLIVLNHIPIVSKLTNADARIAAYLGLPSNLSLFTLIEFLLIPLLLIIVWIFSIWGPYRLTRGRSHR